MNISVSITCARMNSKLAVSRFQIKVVGLLGPWQPLPSESVMHWHDNAAEAEVCDHKEMQLHRY